MDDAGDGECPTCKALGSAAFVVQYLTPEGKWTDFTDHNDLLAAKNCVSNKRDKSSFRVIKRTYELIELNDQADTSP